MPVEVLQSVFGKNGIILWERANGIDDNPVVPFNEQKSMSKETTYETDTTDVKMIRSTIIKMVEELAFDLRNQEFLTGCVTIKIKYSTFDTFTKQISTLYTSHDGILIQTALDVFAKLYDKRLLIRLVGVKFSNLVRGNYQISLFDDPQKNINLYQALDKIRNKYGKDTVGRAS